MRTFGLNCRHLSAQICPCQTLDRHSAFVVTNLDDGTTRHLAYTGVVSSRPSEVVGNRVWWTEYRRSTLFAERVNSKLCYMDLERGRTRTINRLRRALYPTAISEHELAWVEYFPNGEYNIVRGNPKPRHEEEYLRIKISSDIEIHGLAYDNYTNALYFIATDDSGMWIGRVGRNHEIEHITQGAYITISDLRLHRVGLRRGTLLRPPHKRGEAHLNLKVWLILAYACR